MNQRAPDTHTSTVARNSAPDSSGMMYNGSAAARFVNHAVPPVSNDGSTAMRLMARKKPKKSGAWATSGARDLSGLQSYLQPTRVSRAYAVQLKHALLPDGGDFSLVCCLGVWVAHLRPPRERFKRANTTQRRRKRTRDFIRAWARSISGRASCAAWLRQLYKLEEPERSGRTVSLAVFFI